MSEKSTPMEKFNFLLGRWEMESIVPESEFSKADKGIGKGEFKRALNDKYVTFDYSAEFGAGKGSAHAIFVWDEKAKLYRYWWFEDSGSFMTATCNFITDGILCLNWHNSLLVQTFTKVNPNKVILRMEYPSAEEKYKLVLEVIFNRK